MLCLLESYTYAVICIDMLDQSLLGDNYMWLKCERPGNDGPGLSNEGTCIDSANIPEDA